MQHAVLPVLALIKRNTFSLAYNLIFINHNVRSRNFSVYGKNQLISPVTSAHVVFQLCVKIFLLNIIMYPQVFRVHMCHPKATNKLCSLKQLN